eukprot:scaffold1102_cov256-Pinguiococcus_pyrenoidosus.AAC.12
MPERAQSEVPRTTPRIWRWWCNNGEQPDRRPAPRRWTGERYRSQGHWSGECEGRWPLGALRLDTYGVGSTVHEARGGVRAHAGPNHRRALIEAGKGAEDGAAYCHLCKRPSQARIVGGQEVHRTEVLVEGHAPVEAVVVAGSRHGDVGHVGKALQGLLHLGGAHIERQSLYDQNRTDSRPEVSFGRDDQGDVSAGRPEGDVPLVAERPGEQSLPDQIGSWVGLVSAGVDVLELDALADDALDAELLEAKEDDVVYGQRRDGTGGHRGRVAVADRDGDAMNSDSRARPRHVDLADGAQELQVVLDAVESLGLGVVRNEPGGLSFKAERKEASETDLASCRAQPLDLLQPIRRAGRDRDRQGRPARYRHLSILRPCWLGCWRRPRNCRRDSVPDAVVRRDTQRVRRTGDKWSDRKRPGIGAPNALHDAHLRASWRKGRRPRRSLHEKHVAGTRAHFVTEVGERHRPGFATQRECRLCHMRRVDGRDGFQRRANLRRRGSYVDVRSRLAFEAEPELPADAETVQSQAIDVHRLDLLREAARRHVSGAFDDLRHEDLRRIAQEHGAIRLQRRQVPARRREGDKPLEPPSASLSGHRDRWW